MKRWLVTRHSGAIQWFALKGYFFDCYVAHLDTVEITSGDAVYGTLPVPLVADLCARDIEYWHLCVPIAADIRGKDLSARELERLGTTVKRFWCDSRIRKD